MTKNNSFPIAINIAFIPEQAIYDKCIEISQWLAENKNSPYLLGRDGLPHITLMQGCVADEASWQALLEAMSHWLAGRKKPLLKGKGLEQRDSGGLWWALERNKELDLWHQELVQMSSLFLHQHAKADMFLNKEALRGEKELSWVKGYRDFATIDNFQPHFTLGYGEVPKHFTLGESFCPQKIGIFQMGPYCSCYEELVGWGLK